MSGNKSKSSSRSEAFSTGLSQSASQSFVDPAQQPFLEFLRGRGQQITSEQLGSIGGVAEQLSGQLGGLGGDLLGNLQTGAQAAPVGALTSISSLLGIGSSQDAALLRGAATRPLAGSEALQGIAGGQGLSGAPGALSPITNPAASLDFGNLLQPGAQIGGQLDALDEAIQRNLQSTLGSLASEATVAGQAGGSRQALFASEAGQAAQRAFAGEASNLLAADLQARRGLAGTAAGLTLGASELGLEAQRTRQAGELAMAELGQQAQLAGGGLQLEAARALQGGDLAQAGLLPSLLQTQLAGASAAGDIGIGARAQQTGAAGTALSALPGMFDLGLAPFSAGFAPLLAFGDLVGGPTVLSQQRSRSRQQAESRSRGRAEGSGFSFAGFEF